MLIHSKLHSKSCDYYKNTTEQLLKLKTWELFTIALHHSSETLDHVKNKPVILRHRRDTWLIHNNKHVKHFIDKVTIWVNCTLRNEMGRKLQIFHFAKYRFLISQSTHFLFRKVKISHFVSFLPISLSQSIVRLFCVDYEMM